MFAALTTSACAPSNLQRADRLVQEGQWAAAYRHAVKHDSHNEEIQRRLDEAKTQAAGPHHAQEKQLLSEYNILGALREFKIALGFDPSRRSRRQPRSGSTAVSEERVHS